MVPEDVLDGTPTASDESFGAQDSIEPAGQTDPSRSTANRERHLDPAVPLSEQAQPGRVIAGRYEFVERIGQGAHGEVWTANDLVLHQPVALKWMRFTAGSTGSRIRREVTTLRMLRVPGVVRLLDDGIEEGRAFLVMERVDGRPFPGSVAPCSGTPRRWTWAALADMTFTLLEVLSHVHAAGVVHRDLKPDNILVSEGGHPTILDFGISLRSDPSGDRLTREGQMLGTPRYLAPEQVLGEAVDARADLYVVGVMLYEALTGTAPHEAADVPCMLRARIMERAAPVHEFVPQLPIPVAQTIDRLLAMRIEDRPRSAAEVLAALRGDTRAAQAGPVLPWLGSRRRVEALIEAAAAGRSADVAGPPGSGRSRCLREAAEGLATQGRTVAWTRATHTPLGSLLPVTGAPVGHLAMHLAELTAWMEQSLRAVLAERTVVVADDAEQLDPWSTTVLDQCRQGPGTIIRAMRAASPGADRQASVVLEALEEASLRPLFAGPDRLFHLREDAARVLWERTEGLPARIEIEVTLWTRRGLARWDGPVLVIDRDALDRLSSGLPGVLPPHAGPGALGGEPHGEELLRWLALAGHHLQLSQLAQVMGEPVWRIEAACDALVARGAARRLPSRRVVPRGHVDIRWSPARRLEAHRAIAAMLQPGQEGRLFHLLAAEQVPQAAWECVATARRRAREGDLGGAGAAFSEGLRAVRQHDDRSVAEAEARILAEWVKVAFAEATPHAFDRVLYELTRASGGQRAFVEPLQRLVRAGIVAKGASGMRGMEIADGISPFSDPELERYRQRTRTEAAAAQSAQALLEDVLDQIAAWADTSGEPLAQLVLAEGRAFLRYAQGRFDEAAALHADAAEREPWATGRVAQTLRSASALLEAFRHREAAERATVGRELAAQFRHPYWEGRAEWLLRSAMYRMREASAADLDLVDAARRLGAPDLEALVCLNEAAVAFRAEAPALAVELAMRAAQVWKELNRPWGAMLARCLALACRAPAQPGEVEALADRAMSCRVSGLGVQALGLLGSTFPDARPLWRDKVVGLVGDIPREHWDNRMDVLSVDEALAGALGAPS